MTAERGRERPDVVGARGGEVWVAVADLHGHRRHLYALLGRLDRELGESYRLCTLGDYVDNGEEVPSCRRTSVRRCSSPPRPGESVRSRWPPANEAPRRQRALPAGGRATASRGTRRGAPAGVRRP